MDQKTLREVLSYDQSTGVFTWKKHRCSTLVGKQCGNTHHTGYIRISIKKKSYLAHRLAWIYMHGELSGEIDHVNGIKNDNRIGNLRIASRSQNLANKKLRKDNKAGLKGVFLVDKIKKNRWRASICVGGKNKYLGSFVTPEEAHETYCAAASKAFGDFFHAG